MVNVAFGSSPTQALVARPRLQQGIERLDAAWKCCEDR
jgi:hypothetical protein